ncbi:MAG: hypothetical protein IGS39_01650 [Calothrix sp. C42_A2020_038]|nr:hypothetical protein [Calothrix sp. C42_A2020_038]
MNQEPSILARVASIIGLIGVALYFTGWIYRWTYYGFFQLSISTLDFPIESFFFVTLQVFFGSFWTLCRFLLAILGVALSIRISIRLLRFIESWTLLKARDLSLDISHINRSKKVSRFFKRILRTVQICLFWIIQELRLFASSFPQSLRNEIIIVTWILITLFWLARWQGEIDARRDAGVSSSTLPIITFVTSSENKLALGRNLDDLLTDPPLSGYRIIGDKDIFDSLFGRETNYRVDSEDIIVWRLLIRDSNWIYMFPCLPSNAGIKDRPYVLAVSETQSGDQLLIFGGNDLK